MPIRSSVTDQPGPRGARRARSSSGTTCPQRAARRRRSASTPSRSSPRGRRLDPEALRSLLDDHGLELAAVGTGAGWVEASLHLACPNPPHRAEARDFIRVDHRPGRAVRRPGDHRLDAGTLRRRRRSPDGRWPTFAEALEELGEHAAQLRRAAALRAAEPLRDQPGQHARGTASQLLESLSTKNVKLLADLFHMNIEECDIAGGDPRRRAAISATSTSSTRIAGPPGIGHLDFAPIAAALQAIGYDGYRLGRGLPFPDSDARRRSQTIEAFRRFSAE